ncbi:MAG: hypothetical protein MI892_02670, partial [Desulfobacterales bacterium]|nr:hypothetical protein [Desulfobacterales bacterium]
MKRQYVTVIITLIFLQRALGQVAEVEHFSVSSGLPHRNVQCLEIDAEGYLWVGTTDGVSRYNGYTFRSYFSDKADSNAIKNDFILDIVQAPGGQLLMLTRNGVELYNPQTDVFTTQPSITTGGYFQHAFFNETFEVAYFTNGKGIGFLSEKMSAPKLLANSELDAALQIY